MNSRLAFLRRRAGSPADEPEDVPRIDAEAAVVAGEISPLDASSRAFEPGGGLTPPINLFPHVTNLLSSLRPYLPSNLPDVPPNSLGLVKLNHRSLGLGGRRGMLTRGGLDVAELRGGWLDAVVRFDLWGPDLSSVNAEALIVQEAILRDSPSLRRRGILQLFLGESGAGALDAPPSSWHKTLDYGVLYEYQFQDTDGAASLIARIPIDSETDFGATSHETTQVTDWMVRWDNEGARALEIGAPSNRQIHIRGLSIAAFLPNGGPAGSVIQTAVRNGGTVTTVFDSLAAFLSSFVLDSSPLVLVFPPLPLAPGETQELRSFQVGELRFGAPIVLKGGDDRFRISFSEAAFPSDTLSQVYLRALAS